ncbi:hypothetical protein [Kutzneria buriramensis]|uniref:PPM-type phosphatase domain-containing protein n=1 Tax=Kutzneria buriramensis TaxID=1045776 RepID=A0A3E0I806_9PSEU|nr:hypothetical protein [Kutzneria buriramensis]REH54275.1 hypothetical protein BCF44_102507 [Kutzneria buriramensis]
MRSDLLSVPGAPDRANEDFAALSATRAALVLDGVTPPPDGRTGCIHTVTWYVQQLGPALLQRAATRRDQALQDCLAEAIAQTAAKHEDTCDLSHRRTPQATVVALRWDANELEYLVLSDSVLLVDVDGAIEPILDTRLDELLRRPELREIRYTPAYFQAVEAFRNADGGFYTAAADPEVAKRAVTGRLSNVRAAAAMSDGASRWTEVFGFGGWTELFAQVRDAGAQAVIDEVRQAESADPDRQAFPRGKAHDDASIVFLEF